MKRLLIPIVVAALTVATAVTAQAQFERLFLRLQPVGSSGVSGDAMLEPMSDGTSTRIAVRVSGLRPGVTYVSLFYENLDCSLEADSEEDVIGSPYRADASGRGQTWGMADHPIGELNSVSVRSLDLTELYACGARPMGGAAGVR
jgi:hypothetical protein